MKNTFTPGPWDIGEYCEDGYISITSNGNEVCLLKWDVRQTQRANASLIAAAPEMLEMLLSIQSHFKATGMSWDEKGLNHEISIIINKATGK